MTAVPFPIGMMARAIVSEFRFALENEFDCLELSTNPGAIEHFIRNINVLSRWKKYFPIQIAAIGYFGVEYYRDQREFQNLVRLMDACNHLDTKIIHVGTGSKTAHPDKDIERSIEFLGKAIEEAKKRKLTIALYTCQVSNYAWEPRFWPPLFQSLPDLRMKYDPSHGYHSKRDYLGEIREWGHKIVHLHAKGGYLSPNGTRDPMGDPPPGEDQIDWLGLLQTLIDVNYKGAMVIEMHSDRYSYNEYFEALKRSRNYLRNLNQSLLAPEGLQGIQM